MPLDHQFCPWSPAGFGEYIEGTPPSSRLLSAEKAINPPAHPRLTGRGGSHLEMFLHGRTCFCCRTGTSASHCGTGGAGNPSCAGTQALCPGGGGRDREERAEGQPRPSLQVARAASPHGRNMDSPFLEATICSLPRPCHQCLWKWK